MSVRAIVTLWIAIAISAIPLSAKDREPQTWRATRTSDPITGATSCVVSALDYVGKTRFSRSGYLYPIIEMNGASGLLVGVSSGGRFRLPTGTIIWRVDDRPFRQLRAENNPIPAEPATPAVSDAASKAMADTMAMTSGLVLAATATSTVASGEAAKEMLAELRAGHGLLFRAESVAASYGLPDSDIYRVGQFGKDGLKPVPVDASLETALRACGIE